MQGLRICPDTAIYATLYVAAAAPTPAFPLCARRKTRRTPEISPRKRARGRRQCLLAAGGVVDQVAAVSTTYNMCKRRYAIIMREREREMDVWQYAVSLTHAHTSLFATGITNQLINIFTGRAHNNKYL